MEGRNRMRKKHPVKQLMKGNLTELTIYSDQIDNRKKDKEYRKD